MDGVFILMLCPVMDTPFGFMPLMFIPKFMRYETT